ncbi:HEAT repeat [bacterium A37T11]|nr:HEAT repeat [bacterium A37T11]
MKKIWYTACAFLLLCGQHVMLLAQTDANRTESTKIADLLALQPSVTIQKQDDAMKQLDGFTANNIAGLLAGLVPPGGDNSKIEYAANSYSYYVLKAGNEAQRTKFVQGCIQAVGRITDKDEKAFVISLLQNAGKDDAVPALATLLTDSYLGEKAASALAAIQTPVAAAALLKALPGLQGKSQLAAVQQLGYLAYKDAEPELLNLINGAAPKLKETLQFALANIAGPKAGPVLGKAASDAGFVYDTSNATATYLRYIANLQSQGQKDLALPLAQQLFDDTPQVPQLHTHIAALQLLTQIKGLEESQELIKAALSENRIYSNAALGFLKPYLNTEIAAQLQKGWKKGNEDTQVDLLRFFTETKTVTAIPVAEKALQSKSDTVRVAGVKAYAILAEQQSIPTLLKVLSKGDSALSQSIKDQFYRMKGNQLVPQLIAALPKARAEEQVILIEILSARGASESFPAIVDQLKNTDPTVRSAAYEALQPTTGSSNLSQLLQLLADSGPYTTQVQNAIVSSALLSNKDEAVQQITAQLEKSDDRSKAVYFDVLAGIGGEAALAALSPYLVNGPLQGAAIKALSKWSDPSALPRLAQLSHQTTDPSLVNDLIYGIIRLNNLTDSPAEQKVLTLRDAFSVATTADEKKALLASLEGCKTYNALIFAGQFLDDEELKATAANTTMNIALADKRLYGDTVVRLLTKVMGILSGSESGYLREAIRKHISELPKGPGFVSLFNGKDLTGWKGLVEDPIKRSKMDAKALEAAQEKADIEMRQGWQVKNGELVFTGHGNNLATVKQYGDFEMLVDWKLKRDGKDGDAGIYLRGTPQVQIWDTSRVNVGAQVGSGGLYNNQTHQSKPLKVADNPLGDWNTFKIRMIGDRVTVYLNGVLVTDSVVLENYWDRSLPIFAKEQIELQAHGTEVYYRDIYIREIPRKEVFRLSPEEIKEGYSVLFDGTNLDQWTGNKASYKINEEGALTCYPIEGSGGNLYSKAEFSDFVYRFDFRLTPGANNGIGIRAPLEGDAAYVGMEIQVLDNGADVYKDIKPYQHHGSVYGVIPAKGNFLKPVGEWNQEEIYVKGNKIRVTLNGTIIVDGDIAAASKNGTVDHREHPGLKRTSGHLGFLGHGSEVYFKNLRIKKL